MSGVNYDGKACPYEGTITWHCLNPFCGYTFAESSEEIMYRHPALRDIHICPMCHGEKVEPFDFVPPPMQFVRAKNKKE